MRSRTTHSDTYEEVEFIPVERRICSHVLVRHILIIGAL